MPTNSKTTPDAQPTPNNSDQPVNPQPAATSVQPAAPMDESTAENGVGADETPNVSEGEEGMDESKAESQLSEDNARKSERAKHAQDKLRNMMKKLKMASTNVTGRDGFILNKALAYAITLIDILPEERQEASDRENMYALLTARIGEIERELALRTACRHFGLEALFLDPEFEAESCRKLIDNLAQRLGVQMRATPSEISGDVRGQDGDRLASLSARLEAAALASEGYNFDHLVRILMDRGDVSGALSLQDAATCYRSARVAAIESGLPCARFIIHGSHMQKAVGIVEAAGGFELPLDLTEYKFEELLWNCGGFLLVPPNPNTHYLAIEAVLVGSDPTWVARVANAMPLLRGTKLMIE